jgi:hypothetical protein
LAVIFIFCKKYQTVYFFVSLSKKVSKNSLSYFASSFFTEKCELTFESLCLCVCDQSSTSAMAFGAGRQQLKPPERGVFALDHDGECKDSMQVSKKSFAIIIFTILAPYISIEICFV